MCKAAIKQKLEKFYYFCSYVYTNPIWVFNFYYHIIPLCDICRSYILVE